MNYRVLIVNSHLYPGGGDVTYTFNLAELLRRKGHQVALFGMQDERNPSLPDNDLFVSHINYRLLNQKRDLRNGLQVFTRSIYSQEARVKFAGMVERFSPDIVHLQNIHHHITPSIIFEAHRRHIPIVWTLHDFKLVCPNQHFLIDDTGEICEACTGKKFYQPLLKRCKKGSRLASAMVSVEATTHLLAGVRSSADAFISPSQFLYDYLVKDGFSPARVRHVPHFIPTSSFCSEKRNGEYLLFLGKLEKTKGIDILLAASRLSPRVQVRMAGFLDESLEEEALSSLPENVHYLGLKTGAELRDLLLHATAIILPSIWYENQPFSILEAFACQKPVIASNLGGMAELVLDRERGLLVPPNDPQALAGAMDTLAMAPDEAARMGKNAYDYAWQEHHPDRHYQRLMNLYEQLIRAP